MISRELGIEAELIRGDRGVFDVAAGDKLVFSKYEAGRFPEDKEIVKALRAIG